MKRCATTLCSYLFLNGCLELGLAPDCDYAFDLTPVDFAAKVSQVTH